MATKAAAKPVELVFEAVRQERIEVGILGRSPFIANTMSQKAKRQILLPSGPMNAAEKKSNLKHDPYTEFRQSGYRLRDPDAPTLMAILASSFLQAVETAALDTPGVNKTQIGRLVDVEGNRLPLWGTPKLFMAVTRSADIAKTPDIRTRAIFDTWATIVTISYAVPILRQKSVIRNLLITAGVTSGVGDWRKERGSGNYGSFEVTEPDDPRIVRLFDQNRAVQERALAEAEPYDDETEDLLSWYESEYLRRTGTRWNKPTVRSRRRS